jgi:hypothetical protein
MGLRTTFFPWSFIGSSPGFIHYTDKRDKKNRRFRKQADVDFDFKKEIISEVETSNVS